MTETSLSKILLEPRSNHENKDAVGGEMPIDRDDQQAELDDEPSLTGDDGLEYL